MKISCKMITCGRVHLLEEALHSFLLQEDLRDTELIIVNDYPQQKLIFEHPNVKIYNFDKLFDTIGDKENFALEQCSGDIFAVFDDDDLAMPWYLNTIRKYWKEDTNILHWAKGAFYNEPNISGIGWLGNSGIVYSKQAWLDIGKSPIMNAGGDTVLVDKIRALDPNKIIHAEPNPICWFYRWSTPMNYHQSGLGHDTPDKPNIIKRNFEFIENLRKQGKIPSGEIVLKPHWRYDYIKMLNDYDRRKV